MKLIPISHRVDTWFVCFKAHSPSWWFQRFVPGRFKHVAAYGFVPGQNLFVFIENAIESAEIYVAPINACARLQDAVLRDATVVEFRAGTHERRWWQPLNTCTTLVAHFIGCKSRALRPDRFLADLLAEGGEIILEAPDGTQAGRATPTATATRGD